jgi:hypothetical protein
MVLHFYGKVRVITVRVIVHRVTKVQIKDFLMIFMAVLSVQHWSFHRAAPHVAM